MVLAAVIFALFVIGCSDTSGADSDINNPNNGTENPQPGNNNTDDALIVSEDGGSGDGPIVSPDGVLEDISSMRPDYQGIVIKIDDTKMHENVSKRRIYVSHKNYLGEVCDRAVALYDYNNDYTLTSEGDTHL